MPKYQCVKCGAIWYSWASKGICQKCGGKLELINEEENEKIEERGLNEK